MSTPSATVVIPTLGGERLGRVLKSLAAQTVGHQTIVVDNGSGLAETLVRRSLPEAEVLSLPENLGFTRAVNLGAQRADGEAVIMLNDDCVVDRDFVAHLVAALDPPAGVGMVAGVMRDWRDPALIDSAGMELDRTLLVFDYLNGEPLSMLDQPVDDPVGPSAAAAAFDRSAFLGVGGFDENLFAYWEDVDLVLRLRRLGVRCALAPEARGDHEHSATLGSGSARKNYLMGYGRGYVLRKWGVMSFSRGGAVLARELVTCVGQGVLDRNLTGVRGRVRGYRAARTTEEYPASIEGPRPPGAIRTLRQRGARRARLRARRAESPPPRGSPCGPAVRTLGVFHVADPGGPLCSLEAELAWLAQVGELELMVPEQGVLAPALSKLGSVARNPYAALTVPSGPLRGLTMPRRLWHDVRRFRAELQTRRPDLVVIVSATLPAALLASRLERVPAVVYAGELLIGGQLRGFLRGVAGRLITGLTGRFAVAIIACSQAVANQYEGARASVTVIPPPLRDDYSCGDRDCFRARQGIGPEEICIASVGNITAQRGQDVLLRAMARVREVYPSARCLIAGEVLSRQRDHAFRAQLEQLVDELGLREAVVFTGFVDPVADLYAAADLVVNPTRYEAFGRVALEAGLAGRPVVSTNAGAIGEVLHDGENALVVAPDDAAGLADAIVRLISDPELGARLAAGAALTARERCDGDRALARFRGVVSAALGFDPSGV